MQELPKILYLDDEENNLLALKALLRREYDIFTTTSAQEAVAYLNQHEVPVILSDQKMPEISGVEFFELTISDFPGAVRILVTGYADMDAVIDAINKGQVYRYITKPWDEQEIKITIDNAIEKYRSDKQLKSTNSALAKVNADLERFIYSASHDLRAPISTMKGILRLAKMDDLEQKALHYFDLMESTVHKLDDFVRNIIQFYQNLKGEELIADIDFEDIIDGLIGQYEKSVLKDVEIVREINAISVFRSDAHRIKMILGQLLANSIIARRSPENSLHISIAVIQNLSKVVIRYQDNGPTISKEKVDEIFQLDVLADHPLGDGIGLYIAKEATLKLGGQITVQSESHSSTIFTIEIPNKA
jgi:signal transduction histidine kinase